MVSHDRFFLDRIVDHIFVFDGKGDVRDFPGDYSTYRHCVAMQEKEQRQMESSDSGAAATSTSGNTWRKKEEKRKLSFKEKREMEQLEQRIEELTARRAALEADLSSGTLQGEAIVEAGQQFAEVSTLLDEAELRYLELMEIEG